MESEKQGSRRPGQGTRPGSRAPGSLAEQVELTVALNDPPTAGADPADREEERLNRALSLLQEMARAAGLEGGRDEARQFLRQVELDLRTARIQDRTEAMETLQMAAEEVTSAVGEVVSVSHSIDGLRDDTAARAEEITTLFQSACDAMLGKMEETRAAAERLMEEGTARGEEQIKRLRMATDRALDEVRDAARAASWRPWVMATTCALVLTLGVTLMRPGWTMTTGQRRAERVGETVIRAYEAASPAERAEMRKVMGWRDPFPMDTASTTRRR